MSIILQLCLEFFVIGLVSIGGGLATIPFLYELGERTGWFTDVDVLNMLAISESTPGPIGINMSTYVGFATFGVPGGIAATLSLTLPSFIVSLIVMKMLSKFRSSPLVSGVFDILRPASTGLITAAGVSVALKVFLNAPASDVTAIRSFGDFIAFIDYKAMLLAILLFFGIKYLKKLHPAVFIAAAAVIGIIFTM